MNKFTIEEADQFEIHVKDYPDKGYLDIGNEEMCNTAEEVMRKAQQG